MIWCPKCQTKGMPDGGEPCENCRWPENDDFMCLACDGSGWHLGDEMTGEACVVCGGDEDRGYQ